MEKYSDLKFVTPPRNQSQIVTISYAIDPDREQVVSRAFDASDRTTSFAVTPLDNLIGEFDPVNTEPRFADDGLWEPVE